MNRRIFSVKQKHKRRLNFNFRVIWYLVLAWILGFFVSSVVVLPWFYAILPLVVLLLSVFYLDNSIYINFKRNSRDEILKAGLMLSVVWFLGISLFSIFMIVEFYYFNFTLFFSDSRNWFLPATVLIIPIVYSFFLANKRARLGKKRQLKMPKATTREVLN